MTLRLSLYRTCVTDGEKNIGFLFPFFFNLFFILRIYKWIFGEKMALEKVGCLTFINKKSILQTNALYQRFSGETLRAFQ